MGITRPSRHLQISSMNRTHGIIKYMDNSGPKYKGIIFDLDQTLANTEDFFGHSCCEENPQKSAEWQAYQLLKPYLKIVSWEKFIEFYYEARKQVGAELKGTAASHNRYLYIKRTLENLGLRFSPDLVLRATNTYWNHVYKNMKLFPHVEEVLKTIKQFNLKTAIVTDLTADIQIGKLERLKIERYIDFVITSEETLADKPSPKSIKLTLQKMRLKPEDVILIGNNPKTDIPSADAAGIDSVLFDYYKAHSDFKRQKIYDFKEFLQILNIGDFKFSDEKLVAFDLTGTLTTEGHLLSVILMDTVKEYGKANLKTVTDAYEKYKVSAISDDEFWKKVKVKPADIPNAERMMMDQFIIRNGAIPMLQRLKETTKITILSNIPSRWGRLAIEKLDLENFFDEVVFSGDYKVEKPDPALYQVLLERFVVINPANMYVVDNELDDLEAAKGQLLSTIWLKDREEGANYIPDYVVEDISEIVDLVNSKGKTKNGDK